jgi:hypothetical protein
MLMLRRRRASCLCLKLRDLCLTSKVGDYIPDVLVIEMLLVESKNLFLTYRLLILVLTLDLSNQFLHVFGCRRKDNPAIQGLTLGCLTLVQSYLMK